MSLRSASVETLPTIVCSIGRSASRRAGTCSTVRVSALRLSARCANVFTATPALKGPRYGERCWATCSATVADTGTPTEGSGVYLTCLSSVIATEGTYNHNPDYVDENAQRLGRRHAAHPFLRSHHTLRPGRRMPPPVPGAAAFRSGPQEPPRGALG